MTGRSLLLFELVLDHAYADARSSSPHHPVVDILEADVSDDGMN